VNGYSASSSEILTLGLKTYLDNVVILGSNTFGKGVGQMVFEDKNRKLLFYLVDSYWNVRQENITGSRITPDITIESDDLEDYIDFIEAEEQTN
jgi:C-terminal processing protease CtpA/Prc